MAAMGGEVMDRKVVSAKLNRLLLEEREIVGAMAKLKELKNKLKVEELSIMAALRERSMLVEPASERAPGPAATAVSGRLQPEGTLASPSGGRAAGREPPPPPAAPGPAVPTPSAAPGPSAPSQPQLQLSVPWSTVPGYDEEEEEDEDDL